MTTRGAKGVALAGFLATAITFGPARSGYGLFLPYFRDEFALSTTLLGLIGSGLYVGYIIALTATGVFSARIGPKPLVVIGLTLAAVGMATVALAQSSWMLAAGVLLAGSSSGWTWSPYNDASKAQVDTSTQGRTLSVISTGTTLGILAAGIAALLVGEIWRIAWIAFSAAALIVVLPNVLILPTKQQVHDHDEQIGSGWSGWLFRRDTLPLLVVALAFGLTTSVYFSFAVDLVVSSGGISRTLGGPVLYTVMGIAGFVGLFTGDDIAKLDISRVLVFGLSALSGAALLLSIVPDRWIAIGLSAALFGAGVMITSAVLSVWSSTVFPEHPATGFSFTLFVMGLGTVIGPVTSGAIADETGFRFVFLIVSTGILVTGLLRPTPEAT